MKLGGMTCKFFLILSLLPDAMCHLTFGLILFSCVTPAVPIGVAAFSIPGTLMYPWLFSSSSFCLQLLTFSLSSNSCLSLMHTSYEKPILIPSAPRPPRCEGPLLSSSALRVPLSHVFAYCKGVMDLPAYSPYCFIKLERTGTSSFNNFFMPNI